MPCTYEESAEEKRQRLEAHDEKTVAEAIKNTYGPLLCSACKSLERLGYDFGENPELDRWWDEHKASDRRQMRLDQLAQSKRDYIDQLVAKPFGDLTADEKQTLCEAGLI